MRTHEERNTRARKVKKQRCHRAETSTVTGLLRSASHGSVLISTSTTTSTANTEAGSSTVSSATSVCDESEASESLSLERVAELESCGVDHFGTPDRGEEPKCSAVEASPSRGEEPECPTVEAKRSTSDIEECPVKEERRSTIEDAIARKKGQLRDRLKILIDTAPEFSSNDTYSHIVQRQSLRAEWMVYFHELPPELEKTQLETQ